MSGGGDSLALMFLLADWTKARKVEAPVVLVVDHGLTHGSGAGARAVVRRARAEGLKAHVLQWRGAKPTADIEAAARDARYRLIGDWCKTHRVPGVYVGHTLEDQAETFLLRLARGSGLDGLAAMKPVAAFPMPGFGELRVVRPLLNLARHRLRAFLSKRGEAWLEDPMNGDPRFARVRLRAAWPALEELGLSSRRIAAAARHLSRARAALDAATDALLAQASRANGATVFVDRVRLAEAPREIGLRALARLLSQLSGATYRPRFERLERLFDAICCGELRAARTLHGCRIGPAAARGAVFGAHTLVIAREMPRKRPVKPVSGPI